MTIKEALNTVVVKPFEQVKIENVTPASVYGSTLNDRNVPTGYELTGEFRPYTQADYDAGLRWLSVSDGSLVRSPNSVPRLIVRKVKAVEPVTIRLTPTRLATKDGYIEGKEAVISTAGYFQVYTGGWANKGQQLFSVTFEDGVPVTLEEFNRRLNQEVPF